MNPCFPPRVRGLWLWTPLAGLALLTVLLATLEGPTPLRRQACWAFLWNYDEVLDVADDFEVGPGDGTGSPDVTKSFTISLWGPMMHMYLFGSVQPL